MSRLSRRDDGALVLRLKRAWADGTTAIVLSPTELIERLIALIPPPHVNGVNYHGVFAGNARLRKRVVPQPPQERTWKKLCRHPQPSSRWQPWAKLLDLVLGGDPWASPRCGNEMELRAIVLGPPATQRVVTGLTRTARGPPRPWGCFV